MKNSMEQLQEIIVQLLTAGGAWVTRTGICKDHLSSPQPGHWRG